MTTYTDAPTNPLAPIALCLSAAASGLALLPVLGALLPVPLAIVALVLAVLALSTARRNGGVGRRMSQLAIAVALLGPFIFYGIGSFFRVVVLG